MSEIQQIKKYFQDRLLEVNAKFHEHKTAFNTDDIGKTLFDNSFHIALGKLSSGGLKHSVTQDTLNVTVKLFFSAKKDEQSCLFDGYAKALAFKQRCYRPCFTSNAGFMKGITASDITPSSLGTNESAMQFEINFTVECLFGVMDDLTY